MKFLCRTILILTAILVANGAQASDLSWTFKENSPSQYVEPDFLTDSLKGTFDEDCSNKSCFNFYNENNEVLLHAKRTSRQGFKLRLVFFEGVKGEDGRREPIGSLRETTNWYGKATSFTMYDAAELPIADATFQGDSVLFSDPDGNSLALLTQTKEGSEFHPLSAQPIPFDMKWVFAYSMMKAHTSKINKNIAIGVAITAVVIAAAYIIKFKILKRPAQPKETGTQTDSTDFKVNKDNKDNNEAGTQTDQPSNADSGTQTQTQTQPNLSKSKTRHTDRRGSAKKPSNKRKKSAASQTEITPPASPNNDDAGTQTDQIIDADSGIKTQPLLEKSSILLTDLPATLKKPIAKRKNSAASQTDTIPPAPPKPVSVNAETQTPPPPAKPVLGSTGIMRQDIDSVPLQAVPAPPPRPATPPRLGSTEPISPPRSASPRAVSPEPVRPLPDSPPRIDSPEPVSPLQSVSPPAVSPESIRQLRLDSPRRINSPEPISPLHSASPRAVSQDSVQQPRLDSPRRIDSSEPISPLQENHSARPVQAPSSGSDSQTVPRSVVSDSRSLTNRPVRRPSPIQTRQISDRALTEEHMTNPISSSPSNGSFYSFNSGPSQPSSAFSSGYEKKYDDSPSNTPIIPNRRFSESSVPRSVSNPSARIDVQPTSADPRIANRGAHSNLISSTPVRENNDSSQLSLSDSDDLVVPSSRAVRRPPPVQTQQIFERAPSERDGSSTDSSAHSSMSFQSFGGGSGANHSAVPFNSEVLNQQPNPIAVVSPTSNQVTSNEQSTAAPSILNRPIPI